MTYPTTHTAFAILSRQHTDYHPALQTELILTDITAFAAFTVTIDEQGDASFRLEHQAWHDGARADALEAIIAAVPAESLVIAATPNEDLFAILDAAESELDFRRALASVSQLPDRFVGQRNMGATCRRYEAKLKRIGAANGLALAGIDDDPNTKARRLAERVQAIWLSYLDYYVENDPKRQLTAAWQAWTALQNARPMPF